MNVLRLRLEGQGSKLVGRRSFGSVTSRVELEAGSKVSGDKGLGLRVRSVGPRFEG